MTRQPTLIARIDRICAWAFLLPFFLMMLMPASVMPTRGADGQMVLVICTGDGPVTLNAGSTAPDVQAKCDWAMGQVDVALAAPEVTLARVLYAQAAPAMAVALWRPSHDMRSVNARGPPVIF